MTAASRRPAPLDDFIAAGARALDLKIDKSWMPAVRGHLQVTLRHGALVAAFALPDDAEPAPAVEFKSAGQVLIVGPAAAALDWAERLAEQFDVSVLATDSRGAELPLERYEEAFALLESGEACKIVLRPNGVPA